MSPTLALLACRVLANTALAADLPTQAQAIALAFPGAEIARHEHFLTPEQVDDVRRRSGTDVKAKYVVTYEATKAGALVGVALFDTHVVRTAPETVMVAIAPDGVVLRTEVVQFREPAEYAAPARWVAQLQGQSLGPALSLKAAIRPLSGASLTAQALVDATRRALALFQVLTPPRAAATPGAAP